MKTNYVFLSTMMFLSSCKKEEEHTVVNDMPKSITYSTILLGQVKLTDSALCADVISTSICSGGMCNQHVNLIDSPCADVIEVTSQKIESVK